MNKIFLILFISLLACTKEDSITPKKLAEPKKIFNNTSNWMISKYIENGSDSTKIMSKYWANFSEDATCAERLIFKHPLSEIWAVWEIYDYADGTIIKFWIPQNNVFTRLEGEWYFNKLTINEIYLFRDNQQLIFKR